MSTSGAQTNLAVNHTNMSYDYGAISEDQGIRRETTESSAKGESYSVAVNRADQMTSVGRTKANSPANGSVRVNSAIHFQSQRANTN